MYLQTSYANNRKSRDFNSILFKDKVFDASIVRNSQERFNVLIVGSNSSGKSTLLQTICNSFKNLELVNSKSLNPKLQPASQLKSSKSICGYQNKLHKMTTPPRESNINSFLFKSSEKNPYYSPNSSNSAISISDSVKTHTSHSQDPYQCLENLETHSSIDTQNFSKDDYLCLFDTTQPTNKIVERSVIANLSDNLLFNSVDSEYLQISLTDTPGFNINDTVDIKDKLNKITRHIKSLLDSEIENELNAFRKLSKPLNLIHAIIYVLKMPQSTGRNNFDLHPPNTFELSDLISKNDEYIISRLSAIANVIPVIGKSDTLTMYQRKMLQKGIFYNQMVRFHSKLKLYNFLSIQPESESDNIRNCEIIEQYKSKTPLLLSACEEIYEYQISHNYKQKINQLKEFHDNAKKNEQISLSNDLEGNFTIDNLQITSKDGILLKHDKYSRSKKIWQSDLENNCSKSQFETTPIKNIASPLQSYLSSACLSPLPSPSKSSPSKISMNYDPENNPMKNQPPVSKYTVFYQNLKSTDDTDNLKNNTKGKYTIKRAGSSIPVAFSRSFMWGEMNLANPEHCDLSLLLELLFKTCRTQLIENTCNEIYESYRIKYITKNIKK
ncbi:hypothetical protein BB561_000544 [Smittium simulii]|uniref:Septin-type G domain-containing protein n=1 Tax=Smittium simulii TaxID=133385 RepID=A0A2T9YYP6_9FUNG|nr:hypothetical protein BB561_000544 [Smittium simulii]